MGSESLLLDDILSISTNKIDINEVLLENYISTDNMLPDFGGISEAEKFPSVSKVSEYKINDILFSNIRTYFKKVWFANKDGGCSNDIIVFRTKNEVDPKFAFYSLINEAFIQYTVQTSKGTKMPRGDKEAIKKYLISLPPPIEQKAIGLILSSLDDKIDLNRQMNETLEAMAQALFKSWFVDFDPVIDNALAAGNSIPDVFVERVKQRKEKVSKSAGVSFITSINTKTDANTINQLFPDEFEYTEEMQWIPKGWESTSLGKHINFQTGPAFKSKDFSEVGVKLARGDNVKEGRFHWGEKTRYWPSVDETLRKYLLKSGDVLIGMDGSKVGKNRTRVRESDLPCLLVQRVARLNKKNTICSNFIFLVISSQYFREYVEVVKTGSAIPHISGGQIKELKLTLPKDENDPIFNKFEQLASSLMARTDACVVESLNLTKLRDTLLPKLLSGELRIPDAEKLVEETI